MKIIQLTQNKETLVCECHYDLVKDFKWCYGSGQGGYAIRRGEEGKTVLMHRVINHTVKGFDTDHKNENKLDNRCSNLRDATRSQNKFNQKNRSDNTSGHKGIHWNKLLNKWSVRLCKDGKRWYVGHSIDLEEAIKIYEIEAKRYYGEFA